MTDPRILINLRSLSKVIGMLRFLTLANVCSMSPMGLGPCFMPSIACGWLFGIPDELGDACSVNVGEIGYVGEFSRYLSIYLSYGLLRLSFQSRTTEGRCRNFDASYSVLLSTRHSFQPERCSRSPFAAPKVLISSHAVQNPQSADRLCHLSSTAALSVCH